MLDDKSFHVTIKGLFFDDRGRILLLQENTGLWDLPGGRLEDGETFEQCLVRECREEMGVECAVIDRLPRYAWSARDLAGIWRVMLCWRIQLDDLRVQPSDECVAFAFFARDELSGVDLYPQTLPLRGWLSD